MALVMTSDLDILQAVLTGKGAQVEDGALETPYAYRGLPSRSWIGTGDNSRLILRLLLQDLIMETPIPPQRHIRDQTLTLMHHQP